MITLHVDTNELQTLARRTFPRFGGQIPYATARALTDTVKVLQPNLVDEMRDKFDRVTPWVERGLLVQFARKDDLTAAVYAKVFGGSTPTARVIAPHLVGGGRQQKRFERRLAGYAVPGAGAGLDEYGNLRGKELVEVLSALGAMADPLQNRTKRSAKRGRGRQRQFFRRGNVVYERLQGRKIMPVLVISRPPEYHAVLDWPGRAQVVVKQVFAPRFKVRMAEAVKTAKKK